MPQLSSSGTSRLAAILLWPSLFLAQLIGVIFFTFVFGFFLEPLVYSNEPHWAIVEFVPALLGVLFALLACQWKMLRSSGRWIWVPGTVFALSMIISTARLAGMRRGLRDYFSGEDPVTGYWSLLTLSLALYSLTLFVVSGWEKRHKAYGIPTLVNR